jgi:hypothetical protein
MNRSGRFLAAALVVGLSCSALAAQDAKDKGDAATPKGKKDDGKIPTKDQMLTAGTLSGTLVKLDEDKKFSLSVTYYDIDPGKLQSLNQYYVQQVADISRIRNNPLEVQRRVAQLDLEIARRKQDLSRKVTKDVELQAEDKVKVRSLKPLITYDDKGEIVQHSKEDLKKLAAGGPKLPGVGPTYPASYDKLKEQQKLIVFLAKQKAPTPPPAKKGADAPAGELFQSRPRVVAIVIAEEVAPPK